MWFFLDLAVILVILIFALLSAKKGFVRLLIEIVGFVIVILLANTLSPVLANTTYDKTVEPAIIKAVSNSDFLKVSDSGLDTEVLPNVVKTLIPKEEVLQSFQQNINKNISSGVEKAVTTASQQVIRPVVTSFFSMLYFALITLILLFVVRVLAKLINKVFSFNVVGKANRALGGILGVVKGMLIASICCTILFYLANLSQNGILIFTPENISNSYLFKLFCFTL